MDQTKEEIAVPANSCDNCRWYKSIIENNYGNCLYFNFSDYKRYYESCKYYINKNEKIDF